VTVGTYAFAQLLRVLPRTRISRAVVGAYVRAYRVDLDEAEPLQGPLDGPGAYPSFDAFFTRTLRHGARTYAADANVLVAPSDGRLDALGPVDGTRIRVKGRLYGADDLLGAEEARRYDGGQFAVIYLSPRDYHRVHAPVAGELTSVRSFPGELFPVNSISERHIPDFLVRNRRVVFELRTATHGVVSVVMVAAMIVGRITAVGVDARDVPLGSHDFDPPLALARGDEIGIFHLGSTAVLFLEPGAAPPIDHPLGPIQLGEPLWTVATDG
jgi:phosphatidylserine decarboxylase